MGVPHCHSREWRGCAKDLLWRDVPDRIWFLIPVSHPGLGSTLGRLLCRCGRASSLEPGHLWLPVLPAECHSSSGLCWLPFLWNQPRRPFQWHLWWRLLGPCLLGPGEQRALPQFSTTVWSGDELGKMLHAVAKTWPSTLLQLVLAFCAAHVKTKRCCEFCTVPPPSVADWCKCHATNC